MSVKMKARVVTEDEKESGLRATLNLGHTVGHAIEVATGYDTLRHGEAVSLGMVTAFRLAQNLGKASAADAARCESLLRDVGLPVNLDDYLNAESLAYVASDKKRRGDDITFVIPGAPGSIERMSLPLAKLPELLGL